MHQTYLRKYKRLAGSTIQTIVTAISHYYNLHSLENPTDHQAIKSLLKKYKKHSCKREQLPITHKILLKLLAEIESGPIESYYKHAFYIVYYLMYYLALRVSEISDYSNNFNHAIRLDDVTINHSKEQISIRLVTHKHSTKTTIYDVNCTEKFFKIFNSYMSMRGTQTGPLMIHKNGKAFTRNFIIKQLKKDLLKSGINANLYSSHSFRSGRTTDLAAKGYSDRQLAAMGRWSSHAFLAYIKPSRITI